MRLLAIFTSSILIATLPAVAGASKDTVRENEAGMLKGVVVENEVGGSPVVGVVVTADGANPQITKGGGVFKLVFPDKKPGDTVQIVVRKTDYVVVNDVQLEQVLPARPGDKILKILV